MVSGVLTGSAAYHVEAADCFDFAARIPDGAVNLLWLDGPYNMGKAEWDTFPSVDAFLAFYDRVLDEARRVLAPNGSLYVCTSTAMGGRMEALVRARFAVLNSIRWAKPEGSTKAEMNPKEWQRGFFPSSESIVFAEQIPAWPALLSAARTAAGMTRSEVSAAIVGTPSGACWNWENGQFVDEVNWIRLRDLFPSLPPFSAIERPFNVSPSVPYTDTWTYPTVGTQAGKHLAEKPAAMLRDVIAASSRPGDVVCEWFMGSGVGGEQAVLQGRRYLGCDADPEWARRGVARIERALRAPHEAGRPVKVDKADARQASLFGAA